MCSKYIDKAIFENIDSEDSFENIGISINIDKAILEISISISMRTVLKIWIWEFCKISSQATNAAREADSGLNLIFSKRGKASFGFEKDIQVRLTGTLEKMQERGGGEGRGGGSATVEMF